MSSPCTVDLFADWLGVDGGDGRMIFGRRRCARLFGRSGVWLKRAVESCTVTQWSRFNLVGRGRRFELWKRNLAREKYAGAVCSYLQVFPQYSGGSKVGTNDNDFVLSL